MMQRARWILVGLTLGGLACHSGHAAISDLDGDGVPADQDCDDSNALVWQTAQLHVDQDGDGHGAGEMVTVCVGSAIPQGYAEGSDDCDDFNAAVWSGRPAYVDRDRDGYGSGDPVLVCDGGSSSDGYAAVGGDCDDTAPSRWQLVSLYRDSDWDGVGSGEPVSVCAGDSEPAGYSARTGDCAPEDWMSWQVLPYLYRDADGDGYTVASGGVVCSGDVLPAGYANEPRGVDCDDTVAYLHETAEAYVDLDSDGHGAGSVVTVCTSGSYLPVGYAQDASDCAPEDRSRWQMLAYYEVDQDGDGYTVTAPGTVCSGATLAAPYQDPYSPWLGEDCDDADPAAWRRWSGYADADGDGIGAGPAQEFCIGNHQPYGYSPEGGDCAPDDPMQWKLYDYAYRDADGDGYTAYAPGTICVGTTIPSGYGTSFGKGDDCDDSSPSTFRSVRGYSDVDGDGAGAGEVATFCTDGALPAGYVWSCTDCAPDDPTRWATLKYAYVDRDGDGYTAPEAGQVCTDGALPDPYRAKANGNDCNDGDPTLYQWVVLYQDKDDDGIGASPRAVQCLADTLPAGWSIFGWDVDDANEAVQWTGDEEDELLIAQP